MRIKTIATRSITALTLSGMIALSSVATSFAATPGDIYTATDKAINYLSTQQRADGSIAGYGGESDWAMVALSANGGDPTTFRLEGGASLADFVQSEPTPSSTTGIERKLLALSALHADTTNLKSTLLAKDDGVQLGDSAYLNDDIFGIIAIAATKDASLYDSAQHALDYLITHQDSVSGGFSYCADITQPYCGVDSNDTAAAIVALQTASTIGLTNIDLSTALSAAETYLVSAEQSDGGFGYDSFSASDGSSTAWAAIAFNTVNNTAHADNAKEWLLAQQNNDGGFGYVAYNTTVSDTYTTPSAILALLGTNWLLNPAPIGRSAPIAPTTGTISQPAITSTAATVSVAANPIILASDTSTVAEGLVEAASDSAPTATNAAASETSPDQTTEQQDTTEQPRIDNTARNIGITLIVVAISGLVAYGLTMRHRQLS